ncbi:MAG TPA: hypothetical protein VH107_04175 [Lacipirellulaceae bacterium]|jgi:hypothetical protein|nr:hypothetical protein [Lacipirellulaceae bacterium]
MNMALAEIHDRAIDEIQRRWVRPAAWDPAYRVARDKVSTIAKSALDALLVRDFRVTPYPAAEEYAQLLARVEYWVARSKPIQVRIGYAPLKNPRTVDHTHADWAEFFAICHLAAWHNKVQAVYPPGLQIKIVFDDSTVRMANRYSKKPMREYMRSVSRLIPAMRYESLIVGTMRQSSFAWLFNFGLYQWAAWRLRNWERDPANKPMLDRMFESAQRNLALPEALDEAEKNRLHALAAHRYRVYWEALQLSGFARSGHSLVAMYLDGYQHHVRQPAAFHLRSVGKQQGTQPWQGQGVLQDNGVGKLVPVVLTAKRRVLMDCRIVPLPRLLSLPNFDSITIARAPAKIADAPTICC